MNLVIVIKSQNYITMEGSQDWTSSDVYWSVWPKVDGSPMRNLAVQVMSDIMPEESKYRLEEVVAWMAERD